MKKITILLCGMLVWCGNSIAQATLQPSPQLKEAIQKLEPLVGYWEGEGWIQMGPAKHVYDQKETISLKANNTVLQIDGLGIDPETKELVHQAFAIISYDAANAGYKMMAVRADGITANPDFRIISDGNYEWNMEIPNGGKIRYLIEIQDNKWTEKGAISRDGTNWMPFLEMNLVRLR